MKSQFRVAPLALLSLLLVAACSNTTGSSDLDGFTISLPSNNLDIPIGGSRTNTVTVVRLGAFTGDVTFAAEQVPTQAKVTFDPTVVPAGSTTTAMTIAILDTATVGTSGAFVIRATGGGYSPILVTVPITTSVPNSLRQPAAASPIISGRSSSRE